MARAVASEAMEQAEVDAFLSALEHPQRASILALHQLLLGADPAIKTAIKWKVPSYRTQEFFATLHLRAKQGIGLILHFGAKKRSGPRPEIADPAGLLTWLADDRAMLELFDLQTLKSKRQAVTELVRAWIKLF